MTMLIAALAAGEVSVAVLFVSVAQAHSIAHPKPAIAALRQFEARGGGLAHMGAGHRYRIGAARTDSIP